MSNKKKTNEAQEQATQNAPAALSVSKKGSNKALFEKLKQVDTSELKEETGEYAELKEDSEYNFICHGIEETEMQQKIVKVARLEDEEGNSLIHGAVVLVGAMQKKSNFPVLIRIVTGKFKKTANGKYLDMRVYSAN